jgi:hypothetical protein
MTITERIDALPANEKWAVANVQCTDKVAALAHALSTGEAISVSDGSFKLGHGTAAWVLEAASSIHRITGVSVYRARSPTKARIEANSTACLA